MTRNVHGFAAEFEPQLPDVGFITWSKLAGDPIPAIPAGENYELKKDGKALAESFALSYLPFMAARITNRSDADLSVQLSAQKNVTVDLPKKKAISISGTPFLTMTIYNNSDTDVAEDEIKVTCENDMENVLHYVAAVRSNLKVAKYNVIRVV